MGYAIEYSFDQEFVDLMNSLKEKYGKELFDLDGIGKQLDINIFSKSFFQSNVTADSSIDPNANVDDTSSIAYTTEFGKPIARLDSYFVLWKELKKMLSLEEANDIITRQLTGEIYIHDMHGIAGKMPYCLAKGTRVLTKRGYIKIEDVEIGDMVSTREGAKEVSQLHHLEKDRKFIIKLTSGREIESSPDHKFLTSLGEWVRAEDLVEGQLILASNRTFTSDVYQEVRGTKFDESWGFIIGHLLGDGHTIPSGIRVEFSTAFDEQDRQEYLGRLLDEKVKLLIKKNYTRNDNPHIWSRKPIEGYEQGCSRLIIHCSDFFKLLTEIGYDINWTSHTKEIPEIIFRSPESVICSVLKVLFDCDGTIGKSKIRQIVYKTASKQLAKDIQLLLSMVGITSTFCDSNSSKTPNQRAYRVIITGNGRSVFKEKVGFFSKEKCQKLDEMFIGQTRLQFVGDDVISEILSIEEEEGQFEFFDLGVEDSHEYVANGFVVHNCFNYSTFDVLSMGLPMVKKVNAVAPNHLYAFKSQLEQFITLAANSTLGATGLADMLISMSYYMKNILATKSDAHFHFASEEDCWTYFRETLASFIYTVNQPSRGNQSPFTNLSIYDRPFLEAVTKDIIFPDGSSPDPDLIYKMQIVYMDVMNEELERTPITFPVTTACFSIKDGILQDQESVRLIAEKNKKYAFINIYLGETSTLSSCCRLRSSTENEYFNSFGSGSSKIGSLGVVCINFPRLAAESSSEEEFEANLRNLVQITGKINEAKRRIVKKNIDSGHHPLYELGFMELSKQYSTTGVNGLYEAIQLRGKDILTDEGQDYMVHILEILNEEIDKMQALYKAPHNCEQVPGESSSIKLCKKDKLMGYDFGVEFYSNQFVPLIVNTDLLNRIIIQGKADKYFSGGSVLHINIEEGIESEQDLIDLINFCAKSGVIYFAINYLLNQCEDHHMSIGHIDKCPICGKPIIGKYTRVVGFLTQVQFWHEVRRQGDFPNRVFYHSDSLGKVN